MQDFPEYSLGNRIHCLVGFSVGCSVRNRNFLPRHLAQGFVAFFRSQPEYLLAVKEIRIDYSKVGESGFFSVGNGRTAKDSIPFS